PWRRSFQSTPGSLRSRQSQRTGSGVTRLPSTCFFYCSLSSASASPSTGAFFLYAPRTDFQHFAATDTGRGRYLAAARRRPRPVPLSFNVRFRRSSSFHGSSKEEHSPGCTTKASLVQAHVGGCGGHSVFGFHDWFER